MVSYSQITIGGSVVSDFINATITNSTSVNNTASSFNGNLNNEYGKNRNKYVVGQEIVCYLGSLPINLGVYSGNKIFTGLVEDIKFKGKGMTETMVIDGRDYSARLVDRTVEPEVYNNLQPGSIVKDIIEKYTDGITGSNVIIAGSALSRIVFNQTPVFDAIKKLADMTDYMFYVDTEKDLHFEPIGSNSTGYTFDSGTILNTDFTERRDTCFNQVWVYGDRYLDAYQEIKNGNEAVDVSGGTLTGGSIINLLYKPSAVSIFYSGTTTAIQPGAVYEMSQSTGSLVRYLVNYDGKQIVFTSGTLQGNNIPVAGSYYQIQYQRQLPVISMGEDNTSIERYGKRVKIITDKEIKDATTAQSIMKSELDRYADPTKEGNIQLKNVTYLKPSQTCIVNLPYEDVNNIEYDIVEAKYSINKEDLLADRFLKIKVNKKLPTLTDTLKDLILGLRKVQGQDLIDTDILPRFQISAGSLGIRQSGCIVYSNSITGSCLCLASPGLPVPLTILGTLASGTLQKGLAGNPNGSAFTPFTIIYSGGYP